MREILKTLGPCHAADWLGLAAPPTFALMGPLTGLLVGGAHQMTCPAAMPGSALGGMVPMYVLMSGFHCTPWVKLIARRRHAWRRASVTGKRAARAAGRRLPMTPIAAANSRP